MNVVIAAYNFFPRIGGVETHVSRLADGFVERGHNVTVVTLTPGATRGYNFDVVRNPNPLHLYSLYRKSDLLIHSNLALKLIYPMLILHRDFALIHHSESAFHLGSRLPDRIRRAVLKRARNFVCSGYIGEVSGLTEYILAYPFAPLSLPTDLPASERSNAIFAGRLEEEKGIYFLLDRWSEARRLLNVDELIIVGDGSALPEVERRIAHGEVEHVRYMGRKSHTETIQEMGRAAYAMVPSLWNEPFGTIALEALTAGALVIHSDRGGMKEGTGGFAFLFDPDNEPSWREAIRRACATRRRHLRSPTEWQSYMANVTAHAAKFTPAKAVDILLSEMTGDW